jgi:CHASE2 domain-containing sensor protein
VSKRRIETTERSPVRLLLWTAIVTVLLTFAGIIQPLEDVLRVARNRTHIHSSSGDIVLVPIDDHALREVGRWPWPRRYHAELIDKLTAAGAKQIFFDITFETRSNAADDNMLAAAIARSGRVTLPVRGQAGPHRIEQDPPGPLPMFSRYARLGSIAIDYN